MITHGDHQRSPHITGAMPTRPTIRRKKQSLKFGVGAEKHLFKNTFVGSRPCHKRRILFGQSATEREAALIPSSRISLHLKLWIFRTGIRENTEVLRLLFGMSLLLGSKSPGLRATCGADQSQLISPSTLCPDKHSCWWTEVIDHSRRAAECDVWESQSQTGTQHLIWCNQKSAECFGIFGEWKSCFTLQQSNMTKLKTDKSPTVMGLSCWSLNTL